MAKEPAVPPSAQALLDAVATGPTRVMVSGGVGAGKTATLTAARLLLRTQGIEVRARPSTADPGGAALVVDDAHLLDDAALAALRAALAGPTPTIIVAAEPQQHRPALHDLFVDLGRENPAVALKPLSEDDIDAALTAARDAPPTRDLLRAALEATDGMVFLVAAVINSIGTLDNRSQATNLADIVHDALLRRLREFDAPSLDVLLLTSLAPDLGPADVAAALNLTAGEAAAVVDRVRAGGLADPTHSATFLSAVHAAVVQLTGITRHAEVESGLLQSQIQSETLTTELALRLAEHGLHGRAVADVLAAQARDSTGALAVRLYRAAVDAGARQLAPQLAEALVGAGDCAAGAAVADGLLGSPDPTERAVAVRVAASVAGHDGSAAEAAELFSWLGPHPDAGSVAAGTITQLAVGNLAAARAAAGVDDAGPPTSGNRAARRLAAGLLATIDQAAGSVAMAELGRAVSAEHSPTAVLPDSPAALAALVALHDGDPARARSLLDRAGTADPLFGPRHRLLRGWLKMQDGQLRAAAAETAGAGTLHRRDALWSAALQTAIARRSGDTGALHQHWSAAADVLAEYSVDLFSLLPLGELWVAAARLHQIGRVRRAVDQGFAVLDALGNPALWSVPLHWAGVHAGILAGEPDAVAPHGQALTAAGTPLALALAGAGRAWLQVLAGRVEADEVAVAARALARFGLTGDATRLVSQAALQASDSRVSGVMLALARDLKTSSAVDEVPPIGAPAATAATPSGGRAALSEREREVAELVLLGLPYRDIGKQLFISAKTVEHHVARIRRRLGAESRAEMLSMLRAALAT